MTSNYLKDIEYIFLNLPGHVYWKNREGVYVGCNQAQAISLGFTDRKEIIGKTDLELPWPIEYAHTFIKNDMRVMENDKAEVFKECSLVNGNSATVISNKIPIKDQSGTVIGILGVSIDITEIELAKKKYKMANELKHEFLSSINHDIKTPLSSLISFIEMIKAESQNEKISHLAALSSQCASQLKTLISDFLEASDIELHNINSNNQVFSIKDILDEIYQLMELTIKIRKLRLLIECDDNIPKNVYGHKDLLKRTIVNLVDNAIKYTADGKKISIHVSCIFKDKLSVLIKFYIIDEGMGIPSDKISVIFNKFQRLQPSYKQDISGSGLGLHIVKKYVEKMNGTICVTSKVNQGSKFLLSIPFKIIPQMETLMIDKKDEPIIVSEMNLSPEKEKSEKILLVEDNIFAQKNAQLLLGSLNVDLTVVETGAEAINQYLINEFSVIILDIGLPDISGFEVARKIRKIESSSDRKLTPIIAITAHFSQDKKEEYLKCGIQEIYNKPLHMELINKLFKKYTKLELK